MRGTAERPRLAVFRSNKHIYAQVIDDVAGRRSRRRRPREKGLTGAGATVDAAKQVGSASASGPRRPASTTVVFDRGGFKYHGRVAGVADGARDAGLEF